MDPTKYLTQKFMRDLRPLMEMLMHKMDELTSGTWVDLVNRTEDSVLSQPEQYISGLSRMNDAERSVVHAIFKQFLVRMNGLRSRH